MPAAAAKPALPKHGSTRVSLLAAAAVSASAGGPVQKGRLPLPPRLVIAPWGESRDLEGEPVIVNETTLAELAARQAEFGFDEVALDFAHNTTPKFDENGEPVPLPEPLPVAGYGVLSVEEGVGIVWTPTSWTPEGEAAYRGRHYRDLSPTVGKNEKGEVNFIHSVALCRQGQLAGLHAFSALAPASLDSLNSESTMDKNETDYRALACKMAGVSADATDEELVAAAEKVKPMAPEKAPEAEPKQAEGPDNVTALQARVDQIERDAVVREATTAGKVIPLSAEQIAETPVATLKTMVEKIEPTVPLGAKTPVKHGEQPQLKALSAEEKEVCKTLGISEEDYRKANPAA